MRSWHVSPLASHGAPILATTLALALFWAGLAEAQQELAVAGILYRSGKDYYLETDEGDVYALMGEELDLYQENLVRVTGAVRQREGDMPLLVVSSIQPFDEEASEPDEQAEPEEPGGPETP